MTANIQVIEPTGILDSINGGQLCREIRDHLAAGSSNILVDCQHVTFMDSSGLGALVMALKSVRTAGGKLALCSINDQLQILFQLTKMDQVFEIFANRAAFDQVVSSSS